MIAKSIGFVAMIAAWWYIASTESVIIYEMAKPFFSVVGVIGFFDLVISFRKVKPNEIN